jgi:hypothetical protein
MGVVPLLSPTAFNSDARAIAATASTVPATSTRLHHIRRRGAATSQRRQLPSTGHLQLVVSPPSSSLSRRLPALQLSAAPSCSAPPPSSSPTPSPTPSNAPAEQWHFGGNFGELHGHSVTGAGGAGGATIFGSLARKPLSGAPVENPFAAAFCRAPPKTARGAAAEALTNGP